MNTIFKTSAAALAMTAIAAAAPAMAQESASIPATAEIFKQDPDDPPPSVLVLQPRFAAEFGRIKIPNGLRPGNRCVYQMRINAAGNGGEQIYEEVDDAGMVVGSNSPTATDCAWDAVDLSDPSLTSFGEFRIFCDADREVNFLVRYTGGQAGLFFSAPDKGRVAYGAGTEILQVSDTNNLTTLCVGEEVFGAPNERRAFVVPGAKIILTEDAAPSDGVLDVGTITLEASY